MDYGTNILKQVNPPVLDHTDWWCNDQVDVIQLNGVGTLRMADIGWIHQKLLPEDLIAGTTKYQLTIEFSVTDPLDSYNPESLAHLVFTYSDGTVSEGVLPLTAGDTSSDTTTYVNDAFIAILNSKTVSSIKLMIETNALAGYLYIHRMLLRSGIEANASGVADGSIDTPQLANGAVTRLKIEAAAIGTAH